MNYKVIIIDDDAVAVFLHKAFIIKAGLDLNPECFSDAKLALEYLREKDSGALHRLLLLDINMPELSGWDLLEHIASFDPGALDVIIVSSSINESDYSKAKSFPMVKSYIEKPLTVAKLTQLIESGLLKPALSN
jgi:DNA-binding NtrC family response regulator